MGYVLAGAVLLVILAIGVTLLVASSKRHGRRRARTAEDESYGGGVPGSDTAIIAADPDAPLGDTTEHAGHQEEGATVGDQDADRSGGSRTPAGGDYTGTSGAGRDDHPGTRDDPHVAPPSVGGEGEGRRRV